MTEEEFWVEVAERANEIVGQDSVEIDGIVWDCIPPAALCEAIVQAYKETCEQSEA